MPWGSSGSNEASAVCRRSGGACTGGCGKAGQVVCGGCGFASVLKFPEDKASLGNHSTKPCQCVSDQPWTYHGALQDQIQPLHYVAGALGPALGAAAGLGRWIVGVAVLPVCVDFKKMRRQYSATKIHRALPVREWPALGMLWGNKRSNAASAMCDTWCGGACTGGCGQVDCGGCGFAGLWRFPEEEILLVC